MQSSKGEGRAAAAEPRGRSWPGYRACRWDMRHLTGVEKELEEAEEAECKAVAHSNEQRAALHRGYEDEGGETEAEAEAEAALEELEEAEAEEREVEEAEDLLEYYLQRAATTQSEAERLLAGARDLEESIGVSLSARRFEARAQASL